MTTMVTKLYKTIHLFLLLTEELISSFNKYLESLLTVILTIVNHAMPDYA